MKDMETVYIIEKNVIFDNKPEFAVSSSALINLLTHGSFSLDEHEDAKISFINPKKYTVQIEVRVSEI